LTARTLERRRSEPGRIDPRIDARRKAVARARGRRRRTLAVVLGVAVLAVAGAWGLGRSALLDLDELTVEGAERTGVEAVVAATGVRDGDQLIDIDVDATRARILALPWVADASVQVDWPGALRIRVSERSPLAVARTSASTGMLVDGAGRVLGPATGLEGLPVLEGVPVGEPGTDLGPASAGALELIAILPPGVRSRTDAVVVTPAGELELRARPGGVVRFGPPTRLPDKVLAAQTLFAQVDDVFVAEWDVRVPGSPTVRRAAPAPAPDRAAADAGDD
jgi:cell division protein FtsQ